MATLDFKLNEPIIKALQARLTADLPAELAARAAGLPAEEAALLGPPAVVYDFVPTPGLLTQWPTVGLVDETSDLEDDTGSSVTGKHNVGIIVFLQSPDQRLLAWGLRRYAQACLAVALRERKLGNGSADGAWGTGGGKVRWGPTLGDENDPKSIMSWVVVSFWARREEQDD